MGPPWSGFNDEVQWKKELLEGYDDPFRSVSEPTVSLKVLYSLSSFPRILSALAIRRSRLERNNNSSPLSIFFQQRDILRDRQNERLLIETKNSPILVSIHNEQKGIEFFSFFRIESSACKFRVLTISINTISLDTLGKQSPLAKKKKEFYSTFYFARTMFSSGNVPLQMVVNSRSGNCCLEYVLGHNHSIQTNCWRSLFVKKSETFPRTLQYFFFSHSSRRYRSTRTGIRVSIRAERINLFIENIDVTVPLQRERRWSTHKQAVPKQRREQPVPCNDNQSKLSSEA